MLLYGCTIEKTSYLIPGTTRKVLKNLYIYFSNILQRIRIPRVENFHGMNISEIAKIIDIV